MGIKGHITREAEEVDMIVVAVVPHSLPFL
jgi:hypothetical protein